MLTPNYTLAATLLCCVPALAQITYVDADPAVNTTLANGSAWVTTTSTSGTDGLWCKKSTTASNFGYVYEANGAAAGEDCPMLRTRINGLQPGATYQTFAYFWGIGTQLWRGRALTAATQPAAPIPCYNTNHFATSAFQPMQPLASTSFLGLNQTTLGLGYDATYIESSGRFATLVKLTDGTGYLFEVPLGVAVADSNGELHVYVDDLEFQASVNRTCFDGVGYSLAPANYGSGCGQGQAPTLTASGAAAVNQSLSLQVHADAFAPTGLLLGFSDQLWNGSPLPFDLTPVGFPGCSLLTSIDASTVAITDGTGTANFSLGLPALLHPAPTLSMQAAVLSGNSVSFTPGLHALQQAPDIHLSPVGLGWSRNSVNAPIFRYNAVATHNGKQYTAYYDAASRLVLAKRTLSSDVWTTYATPYTGNTADAHNCISMIVDGAGYLHVAWDHHGSTLHYAKSWQPESLLLGSMQSMIGTLETQVTYPEFYRLADGSLVFLYRDGVSGAGNVVMNKYNLATGTWSRMHNNLLSGQGIRNAYWQACTDSLGAFHLSWVWRENSNANSNHDICYAKSLDGGLTWRKSNGAAYAIPITATTAEYAKIIPQNSSLINSTSMSADALGRPYVVTYWTPSGTTVPQFHVVYHNGSTWDSRQITNLGTPFSLSGTGTLAIPISRPKFVVDTVGGVNRAVLLYRADERSSVVTAAITQDLSGGVWQTRDLTNFTVDKWEPNYDTELWQAQRKLHIYVQRVGQGPNETLTNTPPQMVSILEWTPF